MDLTEYNHVKNMNYDAYCSYLQTKYGIPPAPYRTRLKKKCLISNSRTNEGLVIHHIREDVSGDLGKMDAIDRSPYEYQLPENLCYCDLLEHLFCHILISEQGFGKAKEREEDEENGIKSESIGMSIINSELNDAFSGFIPRSKSSRNIYLKVLKDKDVFFELIKREKRWYQKYNDFLIEYGLEPDMALYHSLNERGGLWSNEQNQTLYTEIRNLLG